MEESRHAYFLCDVGLLRVKISNLEHKPNYDIELVAAGKLCERPYGMGLFSHSNIIYLVGGKIREQYKEFDSLVIKFDHNKYVECPELKDLESFRSNYLPMMVPHVISAGDKSYFISDNELVREGYLFEEGFDFQSFDAIQNCFVELPKPPFRGLDAGFGQFLLGDFIYLFVWGSKLQIFTYNTKSSQWKENYFLVSYLQERKIPPPCSHRGDIGLSHNLSSDGAHIMVALYGDLPTAYLVQFADASCGSSCEEGWFKPISYRVLTETIPTDSYIPGGGDIPDNLADFGGGRFCVVSGTSAATEFLLMYVFKIDFDLEYHIQINKSGNKSGKVSSRLLSSRKFQFPQDLPGTRYLYSDVCFLSAYPHHHQQDQGITPSKRHHQQQDQEITTSKRAKDQEMDDEKR